MLCKILMLLCQRGGHFLGIGTWHTIRMRALLQAITIRHVGQWIRLEGGEVKIP